MKSGYKEFNSVIIILILFTCFASRCQWSIAGNKPAGKISKLIEDSTELAAWITTPDKSALFQKQGAALFFQSNANQYPTITVNVAQKYQSIDGFGFTLTGGSAQVIRKMTAAARTALLRQLFATDGDHIGISYLRVSIGASDLNEHAYTYNDLPEGQTDTLMSKFSLAPDQETVIPVLKEIIAINPAIKILGSPWSPPVWMKTNHNFKGGNLKPEYYDAYARYFIKYIQGMKAAGINIDAITIQNEPLHPGNNPSMLMLAAEQSTFIKRSLGPAFRTAAINTKIILYDHNADRIDYPISILDDPEARKYIDGSAFHLYGGKIDDLTQVHEAYPDKNLYFTEQWIGAPGNFAGDLAWHVKTLIVGATRNWCRNVLEWNLAADPQQRPHTEGGCDRCLGAVTIDGDNVVRNPAYYIIAHASKFVRPGSIRVDSNIPQGLHNVAFETPDHSKVLIVLNGSSSPQNFNIGFNGQIITTLLKPGAVGTYVW